MITTILIFIIVLGVLVFVHELGHFLLAKWSGMMPEEFGFGFPPRIFGVQKLESGWKIVGMGKTDPDKTVYSLNWIPFGAFVRIRGEDGGNTDPKSFSNSTWIKKFATLFAGVGMNVIAAFVLFTVGLTLGLPAEAGSKLPSGATLKDVAVTLASVVDGSPASSAGFLSGDVIFAVNGESVAAPSEVQQKVSESLGKEIEITIKRGGDFKVLKVTPDPSPKEGRGALGVELAQVGTLSYPWYKAPIVAARITGEQLLAIIKGLGQLFGGGVALKDVAGPAKIAQITGQAADLGFGYLLQFAAFLSLNLAVLNVLPFPALDGGRIFFLIVEGIRGKRNNQAVEQWANAIGFLLLILLVGVVTINDIRSFEFVKNIFN
jgi:regulator of sigma E protease